MPDFVSIGPLYMNGIVLSHVLAAIAAWLGMKWWTRSHQAARPYMEILLNAVLIITLFWKFGFILFDPRLLLEQPANVLLMTGSVREIALGLAVAGVYGALALRKRKIAWRFAADMTIMGWLAFIAFRSLLITQYGTETSLPWGIHTAGGSLTYHPVHWYRAIGIVLIVFWLWRHAGKLGTGVIAANGLLYYGVVTLAISFFSREDTLWKLYLNYDQVVALLLILLGYVMHDRRIIRQEGSDHQMTDAHLDSKAQQEHARENAQRKQEGKDEIIDKKLDGPNRPAE